MKILFILDPLEKLDPVWDTSMALARETEKRGHENWCADAPDIFSRSSRIFCRARRMKAKTFPVTLPPYTPADGFTASKPRTMKLEAFGCVVIRKEPPVDAAYVKMTRLLEQAADRVPMFNHPAGIRYNNEKLAILNFPRWIPETLVSRNPEEILKFQKKIKTDLVIKPLNEKGGKGVWRLKYGERNSLSLLRRAAARKTLMAQRFLTPRRAEEKRILMMDGNFFSCYSKRPVTNEFRANLGLGATFHAAHLTPKEKQLVREMKPFLLKEGLYFAGIDVLDEKLIEINVTSPAGLLETKVLYPRRRPLEAWADFLEDFARLPARQARRTKPRTIGV
jgi:glutathione synthase